MRFDQLFIGQTASVSKTINSAEIQAFAELTGDFSPMHFDAEYASTTRFGGVIGHGLLTAGLISNVLGMKLPAKGTIYRSQSLKFKAPCFPGDTITATAEVVELRPERKQVRLRTNVTNQDGTVLIDGEAEMLMLE